LATLAPRDGIIERPAKAKLPHHGRLTSRQAPESGRSASARHPPRPAVAEVRRGDLPAAGAFPAFLHRSSSTKPGSVGRRGGPGGRTQTRGSRTTGSRIGSD
jgi:hypothetical protein